MSDSEPMDHTEDLGYSELSAAEREARNFAMLCHIAGFAGGVIPFGNIIGPLVIWQLKKEHPLVEDQGKESLNFQITVMLGVLVSIVLIFFVVGIFLLAVICIGAAVLQIIAAIKANEGVRYRYPLTIRFVQ